MSDAKAESVARYQMRDYPSVGMDPQDDGPWVHYADHAAALVAARRQAIEECAWIAERYPAIDPAPAAGSYMGGHIPAAIASALRSLASSDTHDGENNKNTGA